MVRVARHKGRDSFTYLRSVIAVNGATTEVMMRIANARTIFPVLNALSR